MHRRFRFLQDERPAKVLELRLVSVLYSNDSGHAEPLQSVLLHVERGSNWRRVPGKLQQFCPLVIAFSAHKGRTQYPAAQTRFCPTRDLLSWATYLRVFSPKSFYHSQIHREFLKFPLLAR